MPQWSWSETFAGQPEMLRYVKGAADAMDVQRSYRFNTKLVAALCDDDSGHWNVSLDDGTRLTLPDPTAEAEQKWTESVHAEFARTLMAQTNAWWIRTTVKPDATTVRRTLVCIGGGPQ